jgi:hypothetical protein
VRDLLGAALPSRIKGRQSLLRRLRGLLLAVARFAEHRARTEADRRWAAAVLDHLAAAVQAADPDGAP